MSKCCARCKTPYNCGWKECPCHPHRNLSLGTSQPDLVRAAAYAERHPTYASPEIWNPTYRKVGDEHADG